MCLDSLRSRAILPKKISPFCLFCMVSPQNSKFNVYLFGGEVRILFSLPGPVTYIRVTGKVNEILIHNPSSFVRRLT